MLAQMFGQFRDASGQNRNLNLGRTRVRTAPTVLTHQLLLAFFRDRHLFLLLNCYYQPVTDEIRRSVSPRNARPDARAELSQSSEPTVSDVLCGCSYLFCVLQN